MRYVVYLDYDGKPQKEVIKIARRLRKKHGLGRVELRVSNPHTCPYHYHVDFERRVDSVEEVREIVKESDCCEAFTDYCMNWDFMVKRLVGSKRKAKPRLIKVF